MACKLWINEARNVSFGRKAKGWKIRQTGRYMILAILLIVFQTGLGYPLNPMVRWSRVRRGSRVCLIGILPEQYQEPFQASWYKDRVYIHSSTSQRYAAVKKATELIIHDFQNEDVGLYHFLYSNNVTQREIIFHLEMLPEEDHGWYSSNSTTVGTVIGMTFLLLMVLVLLYYCCRRDTDTGLPVLPMRQPLAVQNHNFNSLNYKYSGVKFTTQIALSGRSRRRKHSKEVRRDSLNALGAQSRINRSMHRYNKSRSKKKLRVQFYDQQTSTML